MTKFRYMTGTVFIGFVVSLCPDLEDLYVPLLLVSLSHFFASEDLASLCFISLLQTLYIIFKKLIKLNIQKKYKIIMAYKGL